MIQKLIQSRRTRQARATIAAKRHSHRDSSFWRSKTVETGLSWSKPRCLAAICHRGLPGVQATFQAVNLLGDSLIILAKLPQVLQHLLRSGVLLGRDVAIFRWFLLDRRRHFDTQKCSRGKHDQAAQLKDSLESRLFESC